MKKGESPKTPTRPAGELKELRDYMDIRFTKLNEKGDAVEGYLVEKADSRLGKLLILRDGSAELIKLSLSAQLEAKLQKAKVGDYLIITFNGKVKTNTGREMKDFTVHQIMDLTDKDKVPF